MYVCKHACMHVCALIEDRCMLAEAPLSASGRLEMQLMGLRQSLRQDDVSGRSCPIAGDARACARARARARVHVRVRAVMFFSCPLYLAPAQDMQEVVLEALHSQQE